MSRRRTFPLSALSDGQRAAVEEQLGRPIGRGERMKPEALEASLGPSVAAKVRGPYRSRAEADYADFLASLPGVVWRYERLRVGLPGKRSSYLADFTARCSAADPRLWESGRLFPVPCCVEVKGTKDGRPWWREGAKRRALDGAAELWEALRIPLFVAWRVDAVWRHERIGVREGA